MAKTIYDQVSQMRFCIDFWSAIQEEIDITSVAADKSLPSVTITDFPEEATVVRTIAMIKFRAIENTNGAVNKLDGAQEIQVRDDAPGTWRDAIHFVDDTFTIAPATREGGDVIIGYTDITVEIVDLDNTYEFQWDEAVSDEDNLKLNDVQCGLRIYYTV